jgi:hypothetical protein
MPRVEDLGYAYVIHGRGHGPEGTLVQTDWDYPGTAQSLGWSLRRLQWKGKRNPIVVVMKHSPPRGHGCDHSGTDGTINCPDCGITASDFIAAAGEFLRDIAT